MLRIASVYGLISGTIVVLPILLGLVVSGSESFFTSEYFGYLIMLIALSMIFVGVKRYRDMEYGGVITFLPAFGMGLLISVIAAVIYVAIWEFYLVMTDYAFINEYSASLIEAKRNAGADAEELAAFTAEVEATKKSYASPFFRLPVTFSEIFPVGLVIALISAAILRNPKVLPARAAG